MPRIWNWTRENAGTLAAIATFFIGIMAIFQFGVLNPIHQRFDAIDQRFADQDKAINQRFEPRHRPALHRPGQVHQPALR